MIVSQARFFRRQGRPVTVCCQRLGEGAPGELIGIPCQSMSKFTRTLLTSSVRNRLYLNRIMRLKRTRDALLIDHGQFIGSADVGYVHNFMVPEYASRMPGYLADTHFPWSSKHNKSILVANSHMVRRGLVEHLKLPEERVVIEYPGYDPERFSPDIRHRLRERSRNQLRIDMEQPVVGLVTSGDLEKRGVRRFLECMSELRNQHPDLRGLILGGGRWPRALSSHPLYKSGQLIYRPSTFAPEFFLAALDLFLFPARYEEFGIVVLEAMAMGIPAVTSSAVGASELLRAASDRLVVKAESDDVQSYCQRATGILALSDADKDALGSGLHRVAQDHTHSAHNRKIRECIDRL